MAKFTATIEQAGDGTWTAAAVIGEHTVLGTGDTKDNALDDLRRGVAGLVDHLKRKGEALPHIEVVSIEVAA